MQILKDFRCATMYLGSFIYTYWNFSEKLIFPTPWYAHLRLRIGGGGGEQEISFWENFAYALNE